MDLSAAFFRLPCFWAHFSFGLLAQLPVFYLGQQINENLQKDEVAVGQQQQSPKAE